MPKFIVTWCLIVAALLQAAAEAATCGSYSSVQRRCFFSVNKPFMAKHLGEKLCHKRTDAWRSCSGKLFTCWKTLPSSSQCGTCSPAYVTDL